MTQTNENRGLGRGIEAFIQREFMALTNDEYEAAYHAYLSCLSADRPDNRHSGAQQHHRACLARFAATCGTRY